MLDFTGLYATDEDVAIKATADYPSLAGRSLLLAAGSDGVFASGNRWLLTSATNDFAAQGVPAGAVCAIDALGGLLKGEKTLFAVSAAASGGLTLRRLGLSVGQGLPPGPAAGVTGLTFSAMTCLPQITNASRWLAQRFRVPTLSTLDAPDDLKRACVLAVLIDYFDAQSRSGGDKADSYRTKATSLKAERDELYAVLDRTYGLLPQARRASAPVAMVEPDDWRVPPSTF